jgi:hypothetical protein
LNAVNLIFKFVTGLAVNKVASFLDAVFDLIFMAANQILGLALDIVKNRQQAPPLACGAIGAPSAFKPSKVCELVNGSIVKIEFALG